MAGPPVPFSELPLNKKVPDTKLNAWGLYGDNDEKGFLNRQTDELVKQAADSEIKTGTRYIPHLRRTGCYFTKLYTPSHHFVSYRCWNFPN